MIVRRESGQEEAQLALAEAGMGDEPAFGEEERDQLAFRVPQWPREEMQERLERSLGRVRRANFLDGLSRGSSQPVHRVRPAVECGRDELQQEERRVRVRRWEAARGRERVVHRGKAPADRGMVRFPCGASAVGRTVRFLPAPRTHDGLVHAPEARAASVRAREGDDAQRRGGEELCAGREGVRGCGRGEAVERRRGGHELEHGVGGARGAATGGQLGG